MKTTVGGAMLGALDDVENEAKKRIADLTPGVDMS
jgi:hypothetical protein